LLDPPERRSTTLYCPGGSGTLTTGEGPKLRPPTETLSQKGLQTTVRNPGSPFATGVVVVAGGDAGVGSFLVLVGTVRVGMTAVVLVTVGVGSAVAATVVVIAVVVVVVVASALGVAWLAVGSVEAGVSRVDAEETVDEEDWVESSEECERMRKTAAIPTTAKKVPRAAAT